MPAAESLAAPTVLVVHANFAVGSAMAARLMDTCLVALVAAPSAVAGLRQHAGFDVVVLCPYLTADERAGLLRACAEQDPPPAVLELCDEPEAADAHVRTVSVPARRRSPAEHVLTALSPLT
ncbi:MAG TPA: hypothetical protein VN213_10560 [Solirubrobacteraceae bacterium]|nr:hypothetical protein [Solirubrobacteraceae bacterium]